MSETHRFGDPTTRQGAPSSRRRSGGGKDVRVETATIGRRLTRVTLEGTFRPGWLGNLGAGLADRGCAILRGKASGDALGRWAAALEIESPADGAAERLDFEMLADSVRRVAEWRVSEISLVTVVSVPDYGGSLRVDIRGADRIGFLAALLDRLALLALFPTAVELDTADQLVADRLWLKAAGFRQPDTEVASLLGRHLGA